MKKICLILAVVALLSSCNSNTKNTEKVKEVTLNELIASSEDFKDNVISVEGMVTHVCKHGGQKLFLTDESGDLSLLVTVSESIPEFDVALEGSDIQVTGKLIVTVENLAEEADNHDGNGEEKAMKAECPTEEAIAAKREGEACETNLVYNLEATSFKEIAKE